MILVVCLLIPSISAKYQYSYKAKPRMVSSDAFYFSTNLTGDSKMAMVKEGNSQEEYQFQEKEEKTWHLYGGSKHTIPIQLRNYDDVLRITQTEIAYRMTLSVRNAEGGEMDTSLVSIRREEEGEVYPAEQTIQGIIGKTKGEQTSYEMDTESFVLDIERYANGNYADGTTVKLLIESTSPYKKVIELNFVLHREEGCLSYEIRDHSGSSYAELLIKNTVPADIGEEGQQVQPYLRWSDELSIDNTNPLTYIYSDSENGESLAFTQQQIENQGQMKRMQISRPLRTNESSSIYFFKSDIEQDYTQETTIVHPSSDGIFEIAINSQNPDTHSNHISSISEENLEAYLPLQEVELSSGRHYSKISSDNNISITDQSAFTLQFTTQYIPGNYDETKESLQTSFHELYLWDGEDTAFTAIVTNSNDIELQSIVKGNSPQSMAGYEIHQENTQDGGNTYYITKPKEETKSETMTKSMEESETETNLTEEVEENSSASGNEETSILVTSEQEPTVDRKDLILADTSSSDFTIPVGTVITMVAQINDYEPTYWYYYCTEEKKEIVLSDFCQMDTIYENNTERYNLYKASHNQVEKDAKEIVTENLRFIFDFSHTKEKTVIPQAQSAQLKHIATVDGIENVEIMNYIGQNMAADGNETISYRSFPKTSNTWNISQNHTNIETFHMSMTEPDREYYARDIYEIQVEISENLEYNDTRCQERQYAVKLEKIETDENGNAKTDENGNIITGTFPEGMIISYNDQELTPTDNNQVFILPVKSAGTHIFQMRTGLSAFQSGENETIMLRASLYASNDASYYNDLNLNKTAFINFEAKEVPEYALFISDANSQEKKDHLFEKGEPLSLNIQTLKNGAVEPSDKASIAIYRWDKQKQNYTHIGWSELFNGEENIDIELTNDSTIWTGHLLEEAAAGVYRLEFCYHDKIEYVDIIVK